MRRPRPLRLALLALALLAAKVAFTRVPRAGNPVHAVHGAYHVHSKFSDGAGTVDEIAEAAARLGLDYVILSDHNVLHPEVLGMRQGVLIIPATEESTEVGHVISLGARRALQGEEKARASDPLSKIRVQGGVPMLAHPYNRRMPFSAWDHASEAAGLEALSYDDLWREAQHAPFTRGLIWGGLEYALNPRLAVAQLVRRPDEALKGFDALREKQPLALLCAVDAHGVPAYGPVLGVMSMYLDGIEGPLGPEKAGAVLEALESGRGYCGLDAIAPAGGFAFTIEVSGKVLRQGMAGEGTQGLLKVAAPPVDRDVGAEIRVLRGGVEIARTREKALALQVGQGVYRVELEASLPGAVVDGPRVPWVLSNTITVR